MRQKPFKLYAALLCVTLGILLTACQAETGQTTQAKEEITAGGEMAEEGTAKVGTAEGKKETDGSDGSQEGDAGADAVSGASQVFYEASSFDKNQLWEAIAKAQGGCSVATVNEDGTPDLIIAVPGTAGDSHLFFNWADNQTKANVLRTGNAMVSYYVYDSKAETKSDRNRGARLKLSLEQDAAVLEQLEQENEGCTSASTVFRIEEILPLG